jgi:hypothetical protein
MLYLMSTTVIPSGANGVWEVTPITLGCAQDLVSRHKFTSAVGHESTAEVMSELLAQPVPMNRLSVQPAEGDHFLCFKLNRRPPEGAILDRTTLEAIGFEWCVMAYTEVAPSTPADRYRIGSWDDFADSIRWSQPPSACVG